MNMNSASASSPALAKKHFSLQRVLLCALPLLVLLLWVLALSSLATAGGTATADSPARMSVPIPPAAKNAAVVMLEISIAVKRKAPAGHLGAVVRLRPSGGAAVEVGRISISQDGSFQFNVASALGHNASGSAEVEVSLIDRGGGSPAAGAAISIGRAQIVTR
jgi:hypothetical protein